MCDAETTSLQAARGCVYEEDLLSGGFCPLSLAACEYCPEMSYA